MNGRTWDLDAQERLWAMLLKAGLIVSESENERASLGRKWFAAFKQLGFVHLDDLNAARLTAVGWEVLNHPELIDLIFLRQLLKYKLGSPVERTRTDGLEFRPFVVLLKLLHMAHVGGLGGLTRDELMIFVIPLMSEDQAELELAFEKIKIFRDAYSKQVGMVNKRAFAAAEFKRLAPATPSSTTFSDYTDSNMRYARMSELITIDSNGGRFKLSPARLAIAESILAALPPIVPDADYLDALHNPASPRLPLDDETTLDAQITQFEAEITALSSAPPTVSTANATVAALQSRERQLRSRVTELTEIKFYRNQRSFESLQQIKELLIMIKKRELPAGMSYAPAFMEWAMWRLMLAINTISNPISETRGFKIDDDIVPLGHAVGGAADCLFEYEDHLVAVEVTLSRGRRQTGMEGEPVRFHVADVMDTYPTKTVYGLFVAPQVDVNICDEFYSAAFRVDGKRLHRPAIVPLAIDDVIALIDAMIAQNFIITSDQMLRLLDELQALRKTTADGLEWKEQVTQVFNDRLTTLTAI
ncbi:AlwI family type II restriction endonuclease [Deinococcus ruber]|nr:AlwI family type II restriction endonuclease [Deinococcus ruber]